MTLVDSRAAITVGPLRTVPNYITAVRTVAAVTVGIVALVFGSVALMAVSYGIYWIGDVLDGWAARRLGQETRAGAVFDIVSDRACTAVLCVGLVSSCRTSRSWQWSSCSRSWCWTPCCRWRSCAGRC
ncbi:CDP-alcohol phosphatidyltransferase family protein [Micromonospora saelicesensis]|uniref:CDP-alcohol phosphatidyltransferase family protein n=1 Tax=Micromonospora saelicesensis TaxID=285676 RepID=UPI003D8C90B1